MIKFVKSGNFFASAKEARLQPRSHVVARLQPHPLCVLLAFAFVAATAARAELSYSVVNNVTTNTWVGATGGDWQTAENWSPATVPAAGAAGTGNYALFNPAETLRVTPTSNNSVGGLAATGVIIAKDAAQVTIQPSTTWGQSAFKLRKNGANYPAIINLSTNHLILNIPVTFANYGSGEAGVLPGVEYGQAFNGSIDNYTFHFYAGDAEATDDAINTSVIKGAATFKAVSIDANHIVQVTGSLTATTLTVQEGGALVVSNAALTATTSLSGAVTLAGAATVSAESLSDVKWTLRPVFKSVSGTGLVADTAKIAKKEGVAAPTADDFTIGEVSGLTDAARNQLTVEVDSTSDASYHLVAVKPAFIEQDEGTTGNTDKTWATASAWDPDGAATAGNHYFVGNYHRLNTPGTASDTFPGDSLTIAATTSRNAFLALKGRENTIGTLNLGANGEVRFNTYNNGSSSGQTLKGSIYVGADATTAAPAYLGSANANANVCEAVISGTGTLRIAASSATLAMNLALNGKSPDFSGALELCGYDNYPATVAITDAAALGTGTVTISNATLKVADDVALSATSPAVTVAGSSSLEVESGKTLELSGTVTFLGGATLTKTGAGSLVAADAYAAGNIAVAEDSAGTATLPSVTATAAEEAARKMAERDWLFVQDGTTANTPAQNLALVTARGWTVPANYGLDKGWFVTLTQTAVDDGGVMLRLSAKKAGMVIVIE